MRSGITTVIGSFLLANVICCGLIPFQSALKAQEIPYGNNPRAGKYVQSDDARIYYEVYGKGPPLLLLHGGYYGYIDEFDGMLPELQKRFTVVAVATRGHGRSEIGNSDYSYQLFARDAINVLNQEKIQNAVVLGFSDGGITGLVLAAKHPALVEKLVCMGGGINAKAHRSGVLDTTRSMDGREQSRIAPPFLQERKKIMPEPERFAEWVEKLKQAWLAEVFVSDDNAASIRCPTLLVGGDRDEYFTVESLVRLNQVIPKSQLLILPNGNHISPITDNRLAGSFYIPFLSE